MQTNRSEIVRLRQRIAAEYVAAQQGLSGLASGISKHAFITHRMECISLYHSELQQLVGEDEATRMMAETLAPLDNDVSV